MKKKNPSKKECPKCNARDVLFTGLGQRDTETVKKHQSGSIRWKFQCKDCGSYFWSKTFRY